MNKLKYYILFSLCSFSCLNLFAKGDNNKVITEAPKTDITVQSKNNTTRDSINYETFKLPPLSVLFENARNNPSVSILEKDRQLQKKLLTKEKKAWMKFFSARGGYAHGVTDNYGTQTDVLTPVFYQYTGIEQNYWNVGGNVNIPIEELFDLKGKVNRQKILLEKAELTKDQAFDQLKQQIIHIYVTIESNIELLKEASHSLALFKGATIEAEEEYRNRKNTLSSVAQVKAREYETAAVYENIRSNIREQILILEIISKTDILPQTNF